MTTPKATIDFETRSEAGFFWNGDKWVGPPGAGQGKKGLPVIAAPAYAEHPSTDILTLSYELPGFNRPKRWRPGLPLPFDLFAWIEAGGAVEAHKVMFERLIWTHVAERRYGFPPLKPENLFCSMATARVNSYPGALGDLGDVLELPVRKNADGRRLLTKFSMPRKPTKSDPRFWIRPEDDPEDAERLYVYCDEDVMTEKAASAVLPPMTDAEREFWLVDQEINWRGLAIDRQGVRDCLAVLDAALARYGEEFRALTGGLTPTQLEALKGWLSARGVHTQSLDADNLDYLLKTVLPHPPGGLNPVRRALEIRALIGSASVKKCYAMENVASSDDRVRDLIVHHGARTGRPTGEGPQPLNLPKDGPKLVKCPSCSKPYAPARAICPWCGSTERSTKKPKWSFEYADDVLSVMATRSLEAVEYYFGDAVLSIMGCVRSLFVAGPQMELIASDYSSIEAVVIAMLAGEQWRIDAFKNNEPIYLLSAAKITGRSVDEYVRYHEQNGEHHPDRQKIGKVAELGLGFGGWIGAWRVFDDSDTFTDDEVKGHIKAWREASPAIVELWGGQWRGSPWNGSPERYGFEGAAVNAIQFPGELFTHAGISFRVEKMPNGRPALMVTLLSGRRLTYHEPALTPSQRPYAAPDELSISYMTWNSNTKMGPLGWVRMSTFGGRLTENIVQAIAHDLLRFGILNLRAAGFPTVLHVYDEIVAEIPCRPTPPPGVLDARLAQFESLMAIMPPWALGWPVRASGGWIGRRFRKG